MTDSRFGGGIAGGGAFFVGGSYDLNDTGELIRFFSIEAGQEFDTGGSGDNRFVAFPMTVTLDLWTIRIITNSKTGDVDFNFLNNGVPSNQNITVGAGLTGVFQDLVNSDRIITPNDTRGNMDSIGSGAFLIHPVSIMFRGVLT